MIFKTAIVDELGHIMFWCDELQDEKEMEGILNEFPEWSLKCMEQ